MRGVDTAVRDCSGKRQFNLPEPISDSGFCGGGRKRLKFFAGLKANSLTRRDIDLLAGARVAADAGLAWLDIKHAEAAKLDALTAAQRSFHSFKNRFERLLGFGSGYVCLRDDRVNDIELDHKSSRSAGPEIYARQGFR